MNRRIIYLLEAVFGVLLLWASGIFFNSNFCLTMISPGLYGESVKLSIEDVFARVTDSLSSGIFPLWDFAAESFSRDNVTVAELYPSDSDMDKMKDENKLGEINTEVADNTGTDSPGGAAAGENTATAVNAPVNTPVADSAGILYTADMLKDYSFFVNNFFAIDSSTEAPEGLLDAEQFLNMDLTIDIHGEEPKILIYHTHSQEAFADSRPEMWEDTVVGLGEILTNELNSRYGISTLHLKDTFDVIDGVTDRSAAYTYAEERVREILVEYPSIKVVIDIHRDGVGDETRLVTDVNGKQTAQIMFLDGLCRTSASGPIDYLQNPYLSENLAFSTKLQLKAAQYYPDFTRRIYLRAYQYNLHILPRALLIECGAQTNTVEEVQNAMPPLADLLYLVLSGAS